MSTTESGPAVPEWMQRLGITARREWLHNAKAQWLGLMGPRYPLKVRCYACLMLHTAGYRDERAIKQVANRDGDGAKFAPLTPADIIREIHQQTVRYYRSGKITDNLDAFREDRQNIRRALAELEQDGLTERRRVSDGKPLRELSEAEAKRLSAGKVEYLAWLEPRKPDPETVQAHYAEQLEERAAKVVTTRLPFDADTVRSIRHIISAFGLKDSAFLRLSEQTAESDVQVIAQAIEAAKDSFIDAIRKQRPDAKLDSEADSFAESSPAAESEQQAKPEAASSAVATANLTERSDAHSQSLNTEQSPIESQQDFHETPAAAQHRPAAAPESEVMPNAPGKIPAKATPVTPAAAAEQSPKAAADPLRLLLVSLQCHFDDPTLERIRNELNGTPLEQYAISLRERRRRGPISFHAALQWAKAARKNHDASAALLAERVDANRARSERQHEDNMFWAQRILAQPAKASTEELDWAHAVMREAS